MNSNYDKKIVINTNNILKNININKKVLSSYKNEETAIIKINDKSKFSKKTKINSVEILVLNGTYINEYGKFKKGTYLRLSKEDESLIKTNSKTTIFRKTNHFKDKSKIIIDTNSSQWFDGQGNLKVMPLFDQTALVKWPNNEKFIKHTHWGGEEIYVLKGTFIDEYGKYEKNTWLRNPHLSQHYPYVKDETIIFVKTGHL
jgi:hypothetical protein